MQLYRGVSYNRALSEITSGLSLYAQPALDARLARKRRVVRYSGSKPSQMMHPMKG